MRLILASASPRRAELLAAAGFAFEVVAGDVEEVPRADEAPDRYTARVAREKAQSVWRRHADDGQAVVLAADTEVVVDRRILGKPSDTAHAASILRLLSGTAHDVLTAVVVIACGGEATEVVVTRVHVAPLTEDEIAWYVASGEPMGKAGAYAIQGLGARFIERIEGSWSNVVGLPVAIVYRMLRAIE